MKKRIKEAFISLLIAGSLICGPAYDAYGLDYTDYVDTLEADTENMYLKIRYQVILPRYSQCYAVFTFNGGAIVWTGDSGETGIGSTHSLGTSVADAYDISSVFARQEEADTLGPQTYKALKSGIDGNTIYDKQWCSKIIYSSEEEIYTRRLYLYKMSFDIYGLDTRDLTGVYYYCIEQDGTGTCFRHQELSELVAQLVPEEPKADEVTLNIKVPVESLDESYGDTVLFYTIYDAATGKSHFVNVPLTSNLPIEEGYYLAECTVIITGEEYTCFETRRCRKYYTKSREQNGMTVTCTVAACNPGGLAHNVYEAGP